MSWRTASFLVALAVGAGAAFKVQEWRYEKDISDLKSAHAASLVSELERVRAEEQANLNQLQEALTNASTREKEHRRVAESARLESIGLRERLGTMRAEIEDITEAAARERAVALGELFGECSERYEAVADKAQRHADDVALLLEAWPR